MWEFVFMTKNGVNEYVLILVCVEDSVGVRAGNRKK